MTTTVSKESPYHPATVNVGMEWLPPTGGHGVIVSHSHNVLTRIIGTKSLRDATNHSIITIVFSIGFSDYKLFVVTNTKKTVLEYVHCTKVIPQHCNTVQSKSCISTQYHPTATKLID